MADRDDLKFAYRMLRSAIEAGDINEAKKWKDEVERIEFDLVTQGIPTRDFGKWPDED